MARLSTMEVIKYSAFETLNNGYTKRADCKKNEVCTADKIVEMMIGAEVEESELEEMNSRIRDWNNYIKDSKHDSEYFNNVRDAISSNTVEESKVGLIASSFASYDRDKQFEKTKALEKESEYLGQEGDSIEFEITDHKLVKTGNSKFGNSGKWFLYKIYSGPNVIIYFADHNCEFEFNHSNKATAVVSKLSTFNEVKQTNVSKLKFM